MTVQPPTSAELALLQTARQAAHLRKWGAGGRLTHEEMAETHTILPPAILAAPPLIDHPVTASTSSHLKYAHAYAHYSAQIGMSERTLKRWARTGKKAGDLFPFDALSLALEWWSRHMRNTPPAELVAAVAQAKRQPTPAALVHSTPAGDAQGQGSAAHAAHAHAHHGAAHHAPPAPGAPSEPGRPLVAPADMVAGTIEENLHRLHVIHSANLTLLEGAFQGSNEADIINRQRNAARSGDMLNAAQRAFDEYQRARGDVVPIADVKRDLLRIHSAMAQSLLSIIEDLGVPRTRCVAAIDSWFRLLRESAFFADTQPAPASPTTPAPPAPAPVTPPDPAPPPSPPAP